MKSKTNKTEEYVLFKEDLSTQTIYELNFKELKLADDEYVTDYEFRFGKVKIGFQEVDSPILYCDILDDLGNGYVFTNKTKVKGNYFEKEVEDNDDWTTITYFKEIKVEEVLPRTRFLVKIRVNKKVEADCRLRQSASFYFFLWKIFHHRTDITSAVMIASFFKSFFGSTFFCISITTTITGARTTTIYAVILFLSPIQRFFHSEFTP